MFQSNLQKPADVVGASNLRLTVDLDALAENWKYLDGLSGNHVETAAVIKANAYGLGIEHVAPALAKAGCRTFYVAIEEEGIRARQAVDNAQIFVLNGIHPDGAEETRAHGISPIISSPSQLEYWAKPSNANTPCIIHIDTGMNRLGLSADDVDTLFKDKSSPGNLKPEFVMSHLACADDPQHPKNREQLVRFEELSAKIPTARRSFSNSAGIFLGKDFHFDQTRPGIALYGAEAVNDVPNPMKPVVLASVRILQIRTASKGEAVGYGASCTLGRASKIAITSVGYADGYHRSVSGSGVPLRENGSSGGFGAIGKHLVPILGRLSMDLTAFDVTDVPDNELESSEWIELFGNQVSIDDAARNCGTIGYELLTSLGSRYQRQYIGKS